MATNTKPVLDLDIFVERRTVKVGGKLFELRNGEEFAPIDLHRISKKGRRMEALLVKSGTDELTDTEAAELESVPNEICKMAVVDGDFMKLTHQQRWTICRFFTNPQAMTAATTPADAKQTPIKKRSTGAK